MALDATAEFPPKFRVGQKVLGPWQSRTLPVYMVVAVYSNIEGASFLYLYEAKPVVGVSQDAMDIDEDKSEFIPETELSSIDTKFIAVGDEIWRVSDRTVVAKSRDWAEQIAEVLNKSDALPEQIWTKDQQRSFAKEMAAVIAARPNNV